MVLCLVKHLDETYLFGFKWRSSCDEVAPNDRIVVNSELEGGGRGLIWGSVLAFAGGAERNHGNVCQINRCASMF